MYSHCFWILDSMLFKGLALQMYSVELGIQHLQNMLGSFYFWGFILRLQIYSFRNLDFVFVLFHLCCIFSFSLCYLLPFCCFSPGGSECFLNKNELNSLILSPSLLTSIQKYHLYLHVLVSFSVSSCLEFNFIFKPSYKPEEKQHHIYNCLNTQLLYYHEVR